MHLQLLKNEIKLYPLTIGNKTLDQSNNFLNEFH